MGILKGYLLGSIIGTPAMPFSLNQTRLELYKSLIRETEKPQGPQNPPKNTNQVSVRIKGKSIIPNVYRKR